MICSPQPHEGARTARCISPTTQPNSHRSVSDLGMGVLLYLMTPGETSCGCGKRTWQPLRVSPRSPKGRGHAPS